MSACYKISGEVSVRRGPAVHAIVARLRGFFRTGLVLWVDAEEREPGLLTVSVSGTGLFTRGVRPLDLEELVRSLGPHAVEPVVFVNNYDHEAGELVVAPTAEASLVALSGHRLKSIEPLVQDLIAADRAKLAARLQRFQAR